MRPRCPCHPPAFMQVLQANVASLPHVVMPVHAALVDTATAEETSTLTFKGRGSEYWGFRVDHNGRKQEDTVTYEVETRTLAQIQVCCRRSQCSGSCVGASLGPAPSATVAQMHFGTATQGHAPMTHMRDQVSACARPACRIWPQQSGWTSSSLMSKGKRSGC